MESDGERPASRGGFALALTEAAGALMRAAAAAGEIVLDRDLRKRGAAIIMGEASRGIQGLQRGLEEGANNTLGAGFKHVQSVLRDIERKVAEFQHQQRARDPASLADWARRQPVDVQIGAAVYEDMPQEVRGRLYAAMAAHPELADALKEQCIPRGNGGAASRAAGGEASGSGEAPQANGCSTSAAAGPSSQPQQQEEEGEEEEGQGSEAPGVVAAGAGAREASDTSSGSSSGQSAEASDSDGGLPNGKVAAAAAAGGGSAAAVLAPCAPAPWNCTSQPAAPSPWGSVDAEGGGDTEAAPPHPTAALDGGSGASSSSGGGGRGLTTAPAPAAPAAAAAAAAAAAQDGEQKATPAAEDAPSPHPVTSHPVAIDAADEWELLAKDSVGGAVGDSGAVEAVETLRTLLQSMLEGAPLDPARAAQAAMLQAMLDVDWPPGGPDSAPPPDPASEYAQLAATPAGQAVQRCMGGVEPVDDVIARDLGRTFPEHPLFTEGDGQARLGRLLRAFALRDEEIGYCQGQAFAAGLLLMYAREEDAFHLYCRLMDPPPAGSGLRRLYLPGLEPLKLELSRFELLLASHLPALHAHLQSAGLPAVLYASSWLMTLFASPFPLAFAGRVLDVLLVSGEGAVGVLLRVALALLEALQSELLAHDDFEGLITAIKVGPLQWPVQVYRHVLDRALSADFITEDELAAAWTAAVAEAARLGRPSSFTSRRLMRTKTAGGTERLELSPLAEDGGGGSGGHAAPGSADETADAAGGALVAPSAPSASSAASLVAAAGSVASSGAAAAGAAAAGPQSAAAGGGGGGGIGTAGSSFPDLSELDEFEAVLRDLAYCGILPDGAEGDGGQAAAGGGLAASEAAEGGAAGGSQQPQQPPQQQPQQSQPQQQQQQQQQQHSHVVVL